MQKRLNTQNANSAMEAAGLTQTAISKALGVSREAVSQWLNQKSFPRPNKLLQLGKLLGLSFNKLVIKDDPYAPKVAFRKKKGTKTKDHHIEKAQEIGCFLRHLVPYLPFDTLETPPVLKSPNCDYDYLEKAAQKVRRDINIGSLENVDFTHLIRRFKDLQAVIVPVLWGSKQRHENALHIYLPDSQSTWVYLNLDVNIHDFKFWMAHELGHCLSPSLSDDEAEDFADAFAGALLFPIKKAEQAYKELVSKSTIDAKLRALMEIAVKETISPYSILTQVNKFARFSNEPVLELGDQLHRWTSTFNKKYKNVSKAFLGDVSTLNARDYIKKTEDLFETPFFNLLRQYLKPNNKGPSFTHTVTDMSLLDARSIHTELT